MIRAFGAHCQFRTNALRQTACLFDDLVGACEHRGRHVEADRLGCLQVDDQLELARPHDRQIAGLLALEDAADIDAAQKRGKPDRILSGP
jgi:hypothetical protein